MSADERVAINLLVLMNLKSLKRVLLMDEERQALLLKSAIPQVAVVVKEHILSTALVCVTQGFSFVKSIKALQATEQEKSWISSSFKAFTEQIVVRGFY